MKNKFFCLLLILILFSGSVFAQDYGVWLHEINIDVGENGNAEIVEKFHLFFNSDEAKIDFRNKSIELGSNFNGWKDFDEQFSPTIAPTKIKNGRIAYSEGEDNYLEIKYALTESLMSKGKENSYSQEYNLKAIYFNKLYQAGLWVIQDNTKISVNLPPGAELASDVYPQAKINQTGTRKEIVWTGHTSGNKLELKYVVWKQIEPIVDLNDLSNFLFRTNQGLVIIGIILIIIGILFWKRNYFGSKIEKFVEDNTLFEEN